MTKRRIARVILLAAMAVSGLTHHSVTKLYDCEDVTVNHCVTYDEGQWREVISYNPYHYKALSTCGHGKFPCVVPHKISGKFWVFK
jgi:hypothetical protein